MKILAIETSGKSASLAILDTENDQTWEKLIETSQGVSEILTNSIQDLLKESNLDIKDIELIAVGVGPGSYTGTRVGIATAKGLAQGLSVKIVGVTSFESLIDAIDENYENMDIIPLIDAKNGRVYFQIGEEQGCDDIEKVLDKLSDTEYVFVGTGATANRATIAKTFQEQSRIDDRETIQARFIAQIAQGRAEANLFDYVIGLKPLYITKPKIG